MKNENEIVKSISKQAHKKQLVSIIYEKSSKNPEEWRTIEPYEIKNGKLYGYDITTNDHIRCFNLDSIIDTKPLEKSFRPRWEVRI